MQLLLIFSNCSGNEMQTKDKIQAVHIILSGIFKKGYSGTCITTAINGYRGLSLAPVQRYKHSVE